MNTEQREIQGMLVHALYSRVLWHLEAQPPYSIISFHTCFGSSFNTRWTLCPEYVPPWEQSPLDSWSQVDLSVNRAIYLFDAKSFSDHSAACKLTSVSPGRSLIYDIVSKALSSVYSASRYIKQYLSPSVSPVVSVSNAGGLNMLFLPQSVCQSCTECR